MNISLATVTCQSPCVRKHLVRTGSTYRNCWKHCSKLIRTHCNIIHMLVQYSTWPSEDANYAKRIHSTHFCEPGVFFVMVISTSRPRQKVCQTTVSKEFWMELYVFRLKFPQSLFPTVQLTIFQNRRQAIILTNADSIHWRVYTALGEMS